MDLIRLDPHDSLRLVRHRRSDVPRRHTRSLSSLRIGFAMLLRLLLLLSLIIPARSLRQTHAAIRNTFPFPRRESEHLTHAHEDGYGARCENFADAALGCGAAHFLEGRFEDRKTGVDDAEEGFEGSEKSDDGVGFLLVGGSDDAGIVDAVDSKSADAVVSSRSAFRQRAWCP